VTTRRPLPRQRRMWTTLRCPRRVPRECNRGCLRIACVEDRGAMWCHAHGSAWACLSVWRMLTQSREGVREFDAI
jgi:hypothetical protein